MNKAAETAGAMAAALFMILFLSGALVAIFMPEYTDIAIEVMNALYVALVISASIVIIVVLIGSVVSNIRGKE